MTFSNESLTRDSFGRLVSFSVIDAIENRIPEAEMFQVTFTETQSVIRDCLSSAVRDGLPHHRIFEY